MIFPSLRTCLFFLLGLFLGMVITSYVWRQYVDWFVQQRRLSLCSMCCMTYAYAEEQVTCTAWQHACTPEEGAL